MAHDDDIKCPRSPTTLSTSGQVCLSGEWNSSEHTRGADKARKMGPSTPRTATSLPGLEMGRRPRSTNALGGRLHPFFACANQSFLLLTPTLTLYRCLSQRNAVIVCTPTHNSTARMSDMGLFVLHPVCSEVLVSQNGSNAFACAPAGSCHHRVSTHFRTRTIGRLLGTISLKALPPTGAALSNLTIPLQLH